MTTAPGIPQAASALSPRDQRFGAWLLGVGSAVPRYRWMQADIEQELAEAWQLTGATRDRWSRICRGAEIEHRYGIAPLHELLDLTTAQRMERFEHEAPPLAARAAQNALTSARIEPSQVTDLIIVTCTGFTAPGVDVAMIDALGLRPNVRRVQVGYMGCFGAVTGLRTAVGACAADPNACALIVCCELCTLHVRRDAGIDNQVASALFGDGAAAAIVGGEKSAHPHTHASTRSGHSPVSLGQIGLGASHLMKEGRSWMTWRITDHGFAMTLAREVPAAIRRTLGSWVSTVSRRPPAATIVHPGGPGILDAAAASMGTGRDPGLEASSAILRDYGNISSGTVLFVIERVMLQNISPPWLILAFGPGLTVEALPIAPHLSGTDNRALGYPER